jgi:hypothetical protein
VYLDIKFLYIYLLICVNRFVISYGVEWYMGYTVTEMVGTVGHTVTEMVGTVMKRICRHCNNYDISEGESPT